MAENGIRATLNERGKRYGLFTDNAAVAQPLKELYRKQPGWHRIRLDGQQALDIIADKISRIFSGDPDYDDNWRDIAGYAQLIVDRINGTGIYANDSTSHLGCTCSALGVGNVHETNCALVQNSANSGGSAGR